LGPTLVALAVVVLLFMMAGRLARRSPHVVVYTSQDQVYAEPLLKDFERRTGVRVEAVFDGEAVKTVGLVNRLMAERGRPQCDVFWNNEALRTYQLRALGVLSTSAPPVQVGYRSRRLVVNTNLVEDAAVPRSLVELTNAAWRGKVALAYPLFGTTATHFHVLRQAWGEPAWRAWCQALQSNDPLVVDGNSVVVRLVGQGAAWVGLTDSDDIVAGQRSGWPVRALPLESVSLLIPNTASLVAGAPRRAWAQRFLDYLGTTEVVESLVSAGALEGVSMSAVEVGTLRPDWAALLADLEPTARLLKETFLR
jgi:iron(III) transport system substrate-binding protein